MQAPLPAEGETDAAPDLVELPCEILRHVASLLIPPERFASAPPQWRSLAALSGTCSTLLHATADALREAVPAFGALAGPSAVAVLSLAGKLHSDSPTGSWVRVRPLRAVRAGTARTEPLHAAPRLSGASLCALAPARLCVFGGRASAAGDTTDAVHLATVMADPPSHRTGASAVGSMAVWDRLVFRPSEAVPAARCYHSATMWPSGGVSGTCAMVVVGGAGDDDTLLDDAWSLEGSVSPPKLEWRQLRPGAGPSPRSSHVCAAWPSAGALVLHGGLGAGGVVGDVWILGASDDGGGRAGRPARERLSWSPLQTAGAAVCLAHHSADVIDGPDPRLVVHSGQAPSLITVPTTAILHLATATWNLIESRGPPASIDGAGVALGGVGVLLFGGVGADFAFCAAEPWLLRADGRASAIRALPRAETPCRAVTASAPRPRACLGLCVDGANAFLFGGFDGEQARAPHMSCAVRAL